MHTVIIVTSDKNERETYAFKLCVKEGIDPLDIQLFETQDTSMGIAFIRDIQGKMYLKPYKGNKKAIIIKDAHQLTAEAQNAMLKMLEEPPNHTLIILTALGKDLLLPTILSRCTIVVLYQKSSNSNRTKNDAPTLQDILLATLDKKLTLAQDIGKNREEALKQLEAMLWSGRHTLCETATENRKETSVYLALLQALQEMYTIIYTTNVNPRLTLENFFLSFPNPAIS